MNFNFPSDIIPGFEKSKGVNKEGSHSGFISVTANIDGKEVKMSEYEPKVR
jgi:hypothetical protein